MFARVIHEGVGVLNAFYYRMKYLLLRRKIVWGRGVRVWGRLYVEGPGTILIGDYVAINGRGHMVTPFTHSKSARLVIGNRCLLNGTRIGCMNSITIGDHCLLGDARIMDADFHPVDPESRRRGEDGKIGSVVIGDNVWIGAGVFVLRDTVIGDDCSIGAGAVVSGQFPARTVIVGNPAKVVRTYSS